jgi:hypothetical protein
LQLGERGIVAVAIDARSRDDTRRLLRTAVHDPTEINLLGDASGKVTKIFVAPLMSLAGLAPEADHLSLPAQAKRMRRMLRNRRLCTLASPIVQRGWSLRL